MIRRITKTLGRRAGVALASALLCSTSVGTAAKPLSQTNSLTSAGTAASTMGSAATRSGYIVASS